MEQDFVWVLHKSKHMRLLCRIESRTHHFRGDVVQSGRFTNRSMCCHTLDWEHSIFEGTWFSLFFW
jgi:hypothetical protein